jgi:hypothetical protein
MGNKTPRANIPTSPPLSPDSPPKIVITKPDQTSTDWKNDPQHIYTLTRHINEFTSPIKSTIKLFMGIVFPFWVASLVFCIYTNSALFALSSLSTFEVVSVLALTLIASIEGILESYFVYIVKLLNPSRSVSVCSEESGV